MAFLDAALGLNSKASIGDVQLDASVSEAHILEGDVSEFAVESGQAITDHYRVRPRVVEIRGIVTDTPLSDIPFPGASLVDAIQNSASGDEAPSVAAYKTLEGYFDDAELITIKTRFREYENMVLTSLTVDKEAATANAIHFSARAREVRIVETSTGVALSAAALGATKDAKTPVAQEKQSAGKAGANEANAAQGESVMSSALDAGIEFFTGG